MTRTELALIDSATTSRGYSNELRWNHAYYKLSGL